MHGYQYVLLFTVLIDLLPAFVMVFRWKLIDQKNHPLFFLVFLSASIQLLGFILLHFGKTNVYLSNFYNVGELIVFYSYFKNQIIAKKKWIVFYFPMAIFLGFFVIHFRWNDFMQDSLILSLFLYLLWCLLSLREVISTNNLNIKQSIKEKLFDFAILYYVSFSIVLYLFFNHFDRNDYFFIVVNIVEITFKLMLTYIIWKLPSKSI